MAIDPEWLVRGSFTDLAALTPPIMQDVREELCKRLGPPAKQLRITHFPPGPTLKHCYWWREGRANYSEAQFFAELSRTHPVLSLGVSIEKGREGSVGTTKATRQKASMKRPDWDWSRFVKRLPAVLATDLTAVARKSSSPVYLRIRSRRDVRGASKCWEFRVFSLTGSNWYQRHYGPIDRDAICSYVSELDQQKNAWVIAQVARDFFPNDAKSLTAKRIADILMAFDEVRQRVRRP